MLTIPPGKYEFNHFDESHRVKYTWMCELFGISGSTSKFVTYATTKTIPNAFHRFMQWVCFGNVWTRISPK